MNVNPINIVLLERCSHPLTGDFPDSKKIDSPLNSRQIKMLRIAMAWMSDDLTDDAKVIMKALGDEQGLIHKDMNAGEARLASRILEILWEQTPKHECVLLKEWFSDFNDSRLTVVPDVPDLGNLPSP